MRPCMRDYLRFILFILTLFFFAGNTMTATVAVCQQVPQDTAVRAKLLKRITEMLQFRKNARRREQQRMITIVNGLFVDSLVATPAAIKYLNWALDNERNQNFAQLRQLLNDSLSKRKSDTVLVKAIITDEEMTELASKLVLLLQKKEKTIRNDTAQQQRLKTIRALYSRPPGQVDTLRLNDTTGITYKVQLGHEAEVIGIQSKDNGDAYLNYNFTSLSYLSIAPPGSSKILTAASKGGCKILLTLSAGKGLLQNEEQQFELVDSLLLALQDQEAAGVNVWFKDLKQNERDAFVRFVTILYNYLDHSAPGKYSVSVTIPAYDKNKAYDLRELAPMVKYFLINFTEAPATVGSSDPLKGNNNYSIDAVVSRYVNQYIAPGQFIVMLPYDGIKWTGTGYSYVAYKDIKKEFPADTMINYDVTAASAYVEKMENGKTVQIWFNDPTTLDVKYDYVLRNGLGGVAICPLGADDGYGELWDELTDKFVVADTVWMDTVRLTPLPVIKPGLWTRIKLRFRHEIRAIHMLFHDPCAIRAENYASDDYFKYLTIFLFVCVVIIGVMYAYKLRVEGADWKWRQKVLYLFLGLIVLLGLSFTTSLMLAKRMPWLGLTDDPVECRNISLYNVLVVFLIGIVLGMLLMRVFVFPLARKKDVP
ncbi:glycosyl hydrolase family 18 protein [Chitinophaga sancti]|uniref:glycosyl hydrolase family 18 protein n=1 Tax=Chitinophaga sancti TaxID=1004 RepID=UPI002A751B42|nr:glycosyl hydrolase family 18 protein [Chitinophaga sancti]WPQ60899.1 glycosyl hydrolase family 18 protein [Chitinophaga sancti]